MNLNSRRFLKTLKKYKLATERENFKEALKLNESIYLKVYKEYQKKVCKLRNSPKKQSLKSNIEEIICILEPLANAGAYLKSIVEYDKNEP